MAGAAGLAAARSPRACHSDGGTRPGGQWLTQLVPVRALQRRTAHHAALDVVTRPAARRWPRATDAAVVVKRVTGGHLGDVSGRVEVVGVGERYPQTLGQRRADRGVPAAVASRRGFRLDPVSDRPAALCEDDGAVVVVMAGPQPAVRCRRSGGAYCQYRGATR